MDPKTVSKETEAIQRRFFEALDELIKTGRVAGLQPFTDQHGLHKAKYSTLRSQIRNPEKNSRYKLIDIDSLYYLVNDYKVSADWLLTGRGDMMNEN